MSDSADAARSTGGLAPFHADVIVQEIRPLGVHRPRREGQVPVAVYYVRYKPSADARRRLRQNCSCR